MKVIHEWKSTFKYLYSLKIDSKGYYVYKTVNNYYIKKECINSSHKTVCRKFYCNFRIQIPAHIMRPPQQIINISCILYVNKKLLTRLELRIITGELGVQKQLKINLIVYLRVLQV